MTAERWFEEQSAGAPQALREKAREYLRSVDADGQPDGRTVGRMDGEDVPERLAAAARAALEVVLAHRGDRSIALDLLAADALVTLALKARAREDPAGLAHFAAELLG